jgi:hypothetical protein
MAKLKQKVLFITPRGDLSTATLVEVVANRSDWCKLARLLLYPNT